MRRSFDVGVILAAGASSRMGRPKALLRDARGRTFLARLVDTLRRGGCQTVIVVAGRHAAEIAEQLPDGCMLALNRRWEDGQLSSARVGLRAAVAMRATKCVLHLVDQPLITAADVRGVLAAARGRTIAVAQHRGDRGHPVAMTLRNAEAIASDRRSETLRDAIGRAGSARTVRGSAGCVRGANTPEEMRGLGLTSVAAGKTASGPRPRARLKSE